MLKRFYHWPSNAQEIQFKPEIFFHCLCEGLKIIGVGISHIVSCSTIKQNYVIFHKECNLEFIHSSAQMDSWMPFVLRK